MATPGSPPFSSSCSSSRQRYVIGVDFGTDSVRSILVDADDGSEVASSVFHYPRFKAALYCDSAANQYRQHPLDHLEGLEYTVKSCLQKASSSFSSSCLSSNVVAITCCTTGSTPIAVDHRGTPLSLLPEFANNPNACFVLWKDHTSIKEAADINSHAERRYIADKTNYLQFCGGIYSAEWYWAKLLHVLRADNQVRAAIYGWVENCDWIPFMLSGGTDADNMKRSICSAGHKALWNDKYGFPPDDFFSSLDPLLKGFADKLKRCTMCSSNTSAGTLSPEWASRLGLSTSVVVGVGSLDAHMGAVGGQIEPYYLCKVIGTSTCDMLISSEREMEGKLIPGICGQVKDSIIPGYTGMEAGQSAFGDSYAWFKGVLMWPLQQVLPKSALIDANTAAQLIEEAADNIMSELNKQADLIEIDADSELAVDWLNGRRLDANQLLKGGISGLNLGSDSPRIFRAIAEATCFGAKAIVDRFQEERVQIKGLIGIGGVSKKSPFIMQMMADIIRIPIRIQRSENPSALGAAMFAATTAGIYKTVEDAMVAMGKGFETEYIPNPAKADVYRLRFDKYMHFGQFIESEQKK